MKKKVRIYKAPDGKGKYVNKTSKFLAKAQMGGTPDPSMLAYPGAQPAQQQDPTNQLIQFIVNDITNQVEKEKTIFKLINIMGLPMDAATQLYSVVAEKITEDIEKEDDAVYEEETGQPRKKENPLTKDAVITQRPEEDDQDFDYDLYSTTGRDIVMEESNEPDILDQALDPLAEQRYGGITKSYKYGGTYENALPDIESYESLVEPMTGYDMISQMAWSSETEDEESPYSGNYANTTLDYSKLQNGGAYKKAKKKYVKSVMNLLKKQMGGDNGSEVDPNQGDPTGANFREGKLKMFTNSLKNNAQMVAMQNQIEQQYDQMMQDGGESMQEPGMLMPEQDIENPMHHLNLYSQATSGIFGDPMNETVKAQFGLNIGRYNESDIPRGFYRRTMRRFGNIPNLREVDVRKSGLFGPKQYTMYFDPLPLQQLSNPIAATQYGYGSNSTKMVTRTPAKVVYKDAIIKDVNNQTLKEVEGNTPDNKATEQDQNQEVKNQVSVATQSQVQRVPTSSSSGSGSSATPVVTERIDAWGRAPGDRWYGFDETKKVFTEASTYQPTSAATRLFAAANPEGVYYKEDGRYYKQVGDNYFEIVDPARIKQLKESQVLNYQKIPGVSTTYSKDAFGNWVYYDEKAGKFRPSTDKARLEALQAGKARSAAFGTLKDKPGYYYRIANDGSFIKFKGDPAKHTKSKQPITTIKKGDKEYNYVAKNIKISETLLPTVAPMGDNFQEYLEKLRDANVLQYGGGIENPFANPLEPLQKFVGGGYDPSIPDLTEDNIQYVNSKDISDPYMQDGGLIKSLIPANLVRSGSNDVIQRIYNPVTGQTYSQAPATSARQIAAIDVKRRGITGRPKKYTVYYGAPGSMPPRDTKEQDVKQKDGAKKEVKTDEAALARQTALENAGYGQRTDVSGLKAKSKRAIRQGERKRDRDLEELYEVDPTSVEFDPINIDAPFDRTASNNRAYYLPDLTETTTEEDFAAWGTPKDATEQQIADIRAQLNMDYVPSRARYDEYVKDGIPTYASDWYTPSGHITDEAGTIFDAYDTEGVNPKTVYIVDQSGNFINPAAAPYYGIDKDPNMIPDTRQITSDFAPMSMEGPLATEEDEITPFEQEYMQGYEPTITQEMLDNAAQLQLPTPMTNMGAWSGMDYPAEIIQPGVNPFNLPVSGGEDYYSPFAQPVPSIPEPVAPVVAPRPVSNAGGKSLDQLRAQQQRNPNAGKAYTYTPNLSGMQKDPDYMRAMQSASKDGTITNQEAENAKRVYRQKLAEQEKAKIASQAQRTIDQIMNSSASAAEKRAAREKVILQMQQRWDIIDRTVNSKKYGGGLRRFVGGGPQTLTGETPVTYANNPAIEGAQGQINWNQMSSPGLVTQMNTDGTKSYGVDATYKGLQPYDNIERMEKMPTLSASAGLRGFAKGTDQLAGVNTPLAVDVKNKLTQGEREARLIAGNALLRGVAGYKNRLDDTKQMEGFFDNFIADNLYASDPSRDRGDYAESGLYRPDEQGQTWYGRSAQMGGYIDDDFEDGEEVYMTDEEIKQYMANGGQIEFI